MATTISITRRLSKFARALLHRTHGQDLVEYALLASIVCTVGVIVIDDISHRVSDFYGTAVTEIAARTAAAGTMPVAGGDGGGNNNGGSNNGGSNNGAGSGGDTGGTTGGATGGSTGGTGGGTGGNGNGNGKK